MCHLLRLDRHLQHLGGPRNQACLPLLLHLASPDFSSQSHLHKKYFLILVVNMQYLQGPRPACLTYFQLPGFLLAATGHVLRTLWRSVGDPAIIQDSLG